MFSYTITDTDISEVTWIRASAFRASRRVLASISSNEAIPKLIILDLRRRYITKPVLLYIKNIRMFDMLALKLRQ